LLLVLMGKIISNWAKGRPEGGPRSNLDRDGERGGSAFHLLITERPEGLSGKGGTEIVLSQSESVAGNIGGVRKGPETLFASAIII